MYFMPLNCVFENCQNGQFMLCIFYHNKKKEVCRMTPRPVHSKIAVDGLEHLSISFYSPLVECFSWRCSLTCPSGWLFLQVSVGSLENPQGRVWKGHRHSLLVGHHQLELELVWNHLPQLWLIAEMDKGNVTRDLKKSLAQVCVLSDNSLMHLKIYK